MTALDGALTFARFAYPPNELGYCGPDAAAELLERIDAGAGGPDLRSLAQKFAGAWPYLQLIAAANRITDPLDQRVVEAYWIGNELLENVDARLFADSLTDRFFPMLRRNRERLLAPLDVGAVPHHGFHVLGVYPWVGLLREGHVDDSLRVLDRCRVRWGHVESVGAGSVTVRCRPLGWDGRRLELGPPRTESALVARDGRRLSAGLKPGDACALHWDWVCQVLTPGQLYALRYYTERQLAAVNSVPFSAPASVLA